MIATRFAAGAASLLSAMAQGNSPMTCDIRTIMVFAHTSVKVRFGGSLNFEKVKAEYSGHLKWWLASRAIAGMLVADDAHELKPEWTNASRLQASGTCVPIVPQ